MYRRAYLASIGGGLAAIAGCIEDVQGTTGIGNNGGESEDGEPMEYEAISLGPNEPGDREYIAVRDFYEGGHTPCELEEKDDEEIHLVTSETEREAFHTEEMDGELAALIEETDFDDGFLLVFEFIDSSSFNYSVDSVERADEETVHAVVRGRHPPERTADRAFHGIVARVYLDGQPQPEAAEYSITEEEVEEMLEGDDEGEGYCADVSASTRLQTF